MSEIRHFVRCAREGMKKGDKEWTWLYPFLLMKFLGRDYDTIPAPPSPSHKESRDDE